MLKAIFILAILFSTSQVFAYPTLQERYSVPLEHRQMVVDQFATYLEPLDEFDKRIAAGLAFMLVEGSADELMQTQTSREAALHSYSLALDLVRLTMDKIGWSEPASYISDALEEKKSHTELSADREDFLNPMMEQYETNPTENTSTAEEIGRLMANTFKSYAKENALATPLSKENDRELAIETATAIQKASAADFPQKVSEQLILQRVVRAGHTLLFIGQLGYSHDELNQAWSEAGLPLAQMHFKFLEQTRRGVCSNQQITSRFLRWSGSVSYKYLFRDGSEFLTQTIASCP